MCIILYTKSLYIIKEKRWKTLPFKKYVHTFVYRIIVKLTHFASVTVVNFRRKLGSSMSAWPPPYQWLRLGVISPGTCYRGVSQGGPLVAQ